MDPLSTTIDIKKLLQKSWIYLIYHHCCFTRKCHQQRRREDKKNSSFRLPTSLARQIQCTNHILYPWKSSHKKLTLCFRCTKYSSYPQGTKTSYLPLSEKQRCFVDVIQCKVCFHSFKGIFLHFTLGLSERELHTLSHTRLHGWPAPEGGHLKPFCMTSVGFSCLKSTHWCFSSWKSA